MGKTLHFVSSRSIQALVAKHADEQNRQRKWRGSTLTNGNASGDECASLVASGPALEFVITISFPQVSDRSAQYPTSRHGIAGKSGLWQESAKKCGPTMEP